MEKPEIERRFLLDSDFCENKLPKKLRQEVWIVYQSYLKNKKKHNKNGGRCRVRRMWLENNSSVVKFFLTKKRPTKNELIKLEDECEITPEEYTRFLRDADPKREEIEKIRTIFIWKRQRFELDRFWGPRRLRGLVILEIELQHKDQKVELPSFLPIKKEITYEKGYSNSDLSKRPR